MKKILLGAGTLFASAGSAFAGNCLDAFNQPIAGCVVSVPEISALQGTAAIAAVAAVVLLVWERSRRAA
ncbi:hypothetical protein Q4555_15370 [Octadecabacter sp. 1_MG-2023]|uniref:hypothetical protein n=1 Tax=unclassified Octadecabacter TaxID=196158 RepID=UPI001C0A1284|nr:MULTISPECIES: hypothetical protein [unclassified Octadecabacter]MBU2993998.1 hypothetical protein [Octadecabacter sp. B2R22]MDO6736059.1 hypothetical protein [Octadecabacter sp. 1_MG-2023]